MEASAADTRTVMVCAGHKLSADTCLALAHQNRVVPHKVYSTSYLDD